MFPLLLRLPFELRLQIWELVLGPTDIEPCKCPSKPETCTFNHPTGCCASFDVYKAVDNRLLRICRQIRDEVRPLLSPKLFIVCNGLCLESFFLGVNSRDRRWIKKVRVNLFIGDVSANTLVGLTGQELLWRAEASCGAFVRSALKCQGVGSLADLAPAGGIEEDSRGSRLLRVDLRLT
jgi:hypothetical protein